MNMFFFLGGEGHPSHIGNPLKPADRLLNVQGKLRQDTFIHLLVHDMIYTYFPAD